MQIVNDFRTGKIDLTKFWINLHGKFVYFAHTLPSTKPYELSYDLD
ncbi:MAG: hypothetical protein Q8S19_02840 [Bacillota bacterium]|nr:hypothetical protein [Bacillota bacterium]